MQVSDCSPSKARALATKCERDAAAAPSFRNEFFAAADCRDFAQAAEVQAHRGQCPSFRALMAAAKRARKRRSRRMSPADARLRRTLQDIVGF
jgi:hypothetical protein